MSYVAYVPAPPHPLELEQPARIPASKWQLDAAERHAIYNGQKLRWEIADHHR